MPHPNRTISHPLRNLLEFLIASEVDFVICGGVACILQSMARVTQVANLCLRMDRNNLLRFVRAAGELQLSPRAPVPLESLADERARHQWSDEKHAVVFTLNAPNDPLQVDIFLNYPIDYASLRSRADTIQFDSITVLVSSKEDLVLAKQHVKPPRRIDQRDIEDLQDLIRRERER